MNPPNAIICAGRRVDDQLNPVGPPCGTEFRPIGTAPAAAQARAAGWRIGPAGDAMCPACARPDPTIVAGLR